MSSGRRADDHHLPGERPRHRWAAPPAARCRRLVPADASAAMAVACSAVITGVVPTVSPGKTRPRTPVTRCSSVLAGLPRPVRTSEASRTGTAPSAWVARVVVTFGTVSVSVSPSRRVAESTPKRAGPCSSMNPAGLPGHEPPESSARNPVMSSWRPTQPVCVSERSRSTASRSAPIRAAASPRGLVAPDPGVGDHERERPLVVVDALDRGLAAGARRARAARPRTSAPPSRVRAVGTDAYSSWLRDGRGRIVPKSMTRPGHRER